MDNNSLNYLNNLSINCQGLGDKSKRKDVFNCMYLHNKKMTFFPAKYTVCTRGRENNAHTMKFEVYFGSYRSNAREVAMF